MPSSDSKAPVTDTQMAREWREFVLKHCESVPRCSNRGKAPFSDWPLCDECLRGIALLARRALEARIDEAKREWPSIPRDGNYLTLLQWVQGLDLLQQERIAALEQAAAGKAAVCRTCHGEKVIESKPAGAGHADDLAEYVPCPECASKAAGGDSGAECRCMNNPLNSWPNLPHDKNCPLAAAPSLHKEGPLATDLDDIRLLATIDAERKVLLKGAELLRDAIGAFENNNAIDWAEFAGTANKLEAIATVALHKEGAGGEPAAGNSESTYRCEAGHTFNAVAHSRFDGPPLHCPECGSKKLEDITATLAPLPLQRTLPDEQFKGVVVEPIVTEQWHEGDEVWVRGEINVLEDDDDWIEVVFDSATGYQFLSMKPKDVRAVASPAGRAEQEPK